jgi:hypothetical protein
MARDYRSAQYRAQTAIDPNTGLPSRQVDGQDNSELADLLAARNPASYTMPAPTSDMTGGFEDLTSQYERRNEGAGGVWSGAGKGALAGATYGKYIGGMGLIPAAAGGALIGGIAGAFTKNAKSAMTDFSLADASDTIRNAYRQKMGREASQGEIDSQLGAIGWKPGHDWVGEMGLQEIVKNLDPANDQRAAAAQRVSNPLQAPTSGAPTTQPGAAPAGSGFTGGSGALVDPYTLPAQDSLEGLLANAQRYADYDASTGRVGASGDGTGGYASRGFDFGQDAGNRDIGKSAKYAFAHLAKQASAAGVPQPRTKPEAEAWFTQHIAPGLGQLGYQVEWVKGDKARIHTREGVDEIDYLGNAGGEGEIPLTWQSEVLAPGSGMQGGGMGMGVGSLPTSGMDLSSSAFFDTLMQQARDIASGKTNGASLLDTNALLALLGK